MARRLLGAVVIAAALSALAGAASAADCKAAAPRDGVVEGPVLQVIDGRTLCVAKGPTPDRWVRVRLSDAPAAASRQRLMATAFSKRIQCQLGAGGEGKCTLAGEDLVSLMGSPEAKIEAASWR